MFDSKNWNNRIIDPEKKSDLPNSTRSGGKTWCIIVEVTLRSNINLPLTLSPLAVNFEDH